MLIRQNRKWYDLGSFDLYGIIHRIKNGKLQVRNPRSGKYVSLTGRAGKTVIADATADNPDDLLYEPPAFHQQLRGFNRRQLRDARQPRQRRPVELMRIPFVLRNRVQNALTGKVRVGGMTATELYNIIHPLTLNGSSIKINVSRGDGFEALTNAQTIFDKDNSMASFRGIIGLLTRFLHHRIDYADPDPIVLQVVRLPRHNPPLRAFKDGVFNCACQPVLEHLKTLNQTATTKRTIKRVKALNEKYSAEGIDDEGMKSLVKTAHVNISAIDSSRAVWRDYKSSKNAKTFIYYAHEKHFKHLLVADFTKSVEFNMMNKVNAENIEWLPHSHDYTKLNTQHVEAHRINSKGNQVALVTPEKIYKSKFHQFEQFPKAFTDGGVGKAKFLEQVPHMQHGLSATDPFYQIYFDADVSGFYSQHSPSNKSNVKYDHNHSYKSFKQSPAKFNGFPTIDAVFKVNMKVSESSLLDSNYNGLLYIETKTMSAKDLDKPLYYESSNWYPIEIVKYYYEKYQQDPVIKCFAYAATTFNIDFSKFSNSQFRCFIGKTSTKDSTNTWRTTDKYEYLRALYTLKDKVIGVNHWNVAHAHSGSSTGGQGGNPPIYEVEYKTDKVPWQCPVISAYTKAHQKVIIFEQYNKLIAAGITPVCVRVDGIEIHKDKAEQAKALFDIGTTPGQWKLEPIKQSTEQTDFDILKYNPREVPALLFGGVGETPTMAQFSHDYIIPQLAHFSGAGGNGKTNKLIELKKIYPSLCIATPTHEACDVIEQRGIQNGMMFIKAGTYHRVFGIGCPSNIPTNCTKFAIDECSMIAQEHLILIHQALQKHFNNFKLPFGGAQICLFGDFWQLPCIAPLTPLYNTWTGEKAELYKLFTEIELTKNYRQGTDPGFFALCNSIRTSKGGRSLTKPQALEIIRQLNTRVPLAAEVPQACVELPDYSTLDDMYIAGLNSQCQDINKTHKFTTIGTKVICQKTCSDLDKRKIPNGKVGVILKNVKNDFQVQWADDSISKFRSAGEVKKGKGKSRFKVAMALTVHKSQGKTLRRNVIINPTRLFERNHLYVALTRATKFENIYLTESITFNQFIKTVFVEGYSLKHRVTDIRLRSMVNKYKHEEPCLTVKHLSDMRTKQKNQCCYCKIPMANTFGYTESITLERITNDKPHILSNIKLACFKCNSLHVGQQ